MPLLDLPNRYKADLEIPQVPGPPNGRIWQFMPDPMFDIVHYWWLMQRIPTERTDEAFEASTEMLVGVISKSDHDDFVVLLDDDPTESGAGGGWRLAAVRALIAHYLSIENPWVPRRRTEPDEPSSSNGAVGEIIDVSAEAAEVPLS